MKDFMPIFSLLLLLFLTVHSSSQAGKKDPIVVQITTNHTTVKEALVATKIALMKQRFVPAGGIGESGFTATRTTGAKADYYTADVMAEQAEGGIKITVTFIKSGSGLLKLQKVADDLKEELEGGNIK